MNKKNGLLIIGVLLVVILLFCHYYFGTQALETVMNYPFQRIEQDISFPSGDYTCSGAQITSPTNDSMIFPTNFPMSNSTKLEDIQINFSGNFNTSDLMFNLTYYNDIGLISSSPVTSANILHSIPMGAPTRNTNSDYVYNATISMEKLPSGLPFSNENYLSYNILDVSSGQLAFSIVNGCNNGFFLASCAPNTPCLISINCVKYTLKNPEKPIKKSSVAGAALILLVSLITHLYIYFTLSNNLTILNDYFSSSVRTFMRLILIFFCMLYLGIYLYGLISTFRLIKLDEKINMIGENFAIFWTLYNFCLNIFGFYKLLY